MRARIVLLIVVIAAAFAVTDVRAQTPAKCSGVDTLDNITNTLQITDDTQAYIKSLKAVRDIVDAQIAACENAVVDNATPSDTPEPSNTPVLTLSAAQAQGATRTAIYDARTATASARGATATFVAQYKPIDLRELKNYADKHRGEKVVVKGSIFNVDAADNVIQIYGNGNFNYDFYVVLTDSPQGIYENDFITVYGTVNGYFSYTTQGGNKAQEPQIIDAVVTKP